jgi:hypothetical protein
MTFKIINVRISFSGCVDNNIKLLTQPKDELPY